MFLKRLQSLTLAYVASKMNALPVHALIQVVKEEGTNNSARVGGRRIYENHHFAWVIDLRKPPFLMVFQGFRCHGFRPVLGVFFESF